MKKAYEQVKRFHEAAGEVMPDKTTMLTKDTECNYNGHDLAVLSNQMKNYSVHEGGSQVTDRASYMIEELGEFMRAETIEDQSDALIDLMYFAIGTFTLMGINPAPLFDIVANANLGKIMPDGTVLRDEQGKIVKPEGWHEQYAPEGKIKAEIERQSEFGQFGTEYFNAN